MLPIMTETTTPDRREILQRARAVRTLAKQRRWAEEMRADGWDCSEAGREDLDRWVRILRSVGYQVSFPSPVEPAIKQPEHRVTSKW
jgi:hypothetical protein